MLDSRSFKTPHETFMKQLHFRHNAVVLQT